jgi:hypothetical protein
VPAVTIEDDTEPSHAFSNPLLKLCSIISSKPAGTVEIHIKLLHTMIISGPSESTINAVRQSGSSLYSAHFFSKLKPSVAVLLMEIYKASFPCAHSIPWQQIVDFFVGRMKDSSIFHVAVLQSLLRPSSFSKPPRSMTCLIGFSSHWKAG